MEKEVHIRQREAVPATGSTLQLMPTGNLNSEVYEIDYFCLTGEVDESAKNWIRLYSSVMPEGHIGEERIIVEDGKIYIKVLPNVEADSRNGIVHLTTMVLSLIHIYGTYPARQHKSHGSFQCKILPAVICRQPV